MQNLPTNNNPIEPKDSSKNIWTIILIIVITTIVVGDGFYLWQKIQTNSLYQEIQDLTIKNEELTKEKESLKNALAENKQKVEPSYSTSSYCTDPPINTDIGRDIYPIDPKYDGLGFLGQFFTAYSCGSERVDKIFGVAGNNYTLGSAIWLKNNPNQSLVNTFKSLEFKCSEETSDIACKKWEILDAIKIDDLIKLEPYHENFKADDCINCG